ncbi:HET domain-containing protein [Colletotrichum zoysiae]|uniref:HET domain-containing protein n=1 Tax=Colletotrichum zoysiae TaxID=1216348 RepID=A0AAD9LXQ7_9PEZI|nr:HET domain-containing protein [Colletotrichum zoysiae]
MESFEYEPLDLGSRSFRLLMLHPGVSGEVECDLFQATLEPGSTIPYEALSYAWGSNDLSESITVNRKTLPVTKSLFHALNHLRHDQVRILWVDAVCIDQGNTAERGHQVGQMGDIYREAEQVLIWLGPSSYETKILMGFLKKLHRATSGDKDQKALDRVQEDWLAAEQDASNDRAALCRLQRDGMVSLFEEPWFTRIWVVQEVSNARAASVCCGRWSVPAHLLATAATLVGVDPSPQRKAILDLMPKSSARRPDKKESLHALLLRYRGSRATDPRDMVYALLGIASDIPEDDTMGLLRPDYSKSETEVVRDLERFLFFGSNLQHQLGQFNNMRALLTAVPELTDMTFRKAIADGRIGRVRRLLKRGQRFEVTPDILLGLVPERMRLALRDLSRLQSRKLTLSRRGIGSVLDRCDAESAKCTLGLIGGRLRVKERRHSRTRAFKLVLRSHHRARVTQEEFAEMAAFCDVSLMRDFINRQQQVFFITARVVLMLSLNERHGSQILDTLLWKRDGRVRVTEDGLLKILEYNDTFNARRLGRFGMLRATVTRVGTNCLDPSWASTIDFTARPSRFRRQVEEVGERLRESWDGIVKAEVVCAENAGTVWEPNSQIPEIEASS